jgi:hypothetical protein
MNKEQTAPKIFINGTKKRSAFGALLMIYAFESLKNVVCLG